MMAQEGKRPFTYSWILILIALVGWMEPKFYQGMEVEKFITCKGARYQNLWVLNVKERKIDCSTILPILWWTLRRNREGSVSHQGGHNKIHTGGVIGNGATRHTHSGEAGCGQLLAHHNIQVER